MFALCATCAETSARRLLVLDRMTGLIATYAGNGSNGLGLDGVNAASVALAAPVACSVDRTTQGVYIADGHRVLLVTRGTLQRTTIAGTGKAGFSGDGYSGPTSNLYAALGVLATIGAGGTNVYIAGETSAIVGLLT